MTAVELVNAEGITVQTADGGSLSVSAKAEVKPYLTKNRVPYRDLIPGVKLLVWFDGTAADRVLLLSSGETPFADVAQDYWAYQDILACASEGLLSGDQSLSFRPGEALTRAELVKALYHMAGCPAVIQSMPAFTDVKSGDYISALTWAVGNKLVSGYADNTFRPDAPITRAELTKIAAGFFSDPRVAATYDGRFSDVQGAEWYISYLMTAIKEGLIEGYPDGSFRPNRPITRAETCTIVNRTLGRKPEKDHLLPESDMINWPDNLDRNVWYYAQMQEATNSHDYRWTSVYSEVCEQWTAKLIERDWAALERTWSHANSAPGGEVMQ